MRVEGRVNPEHVAAEQKRHEKLGIGAESEETGVVDLPADMIDLLRVDQSVWKPEWNKVKMHIFNIWERKEGIWVTT